ncbi:MAG: hypothetical protein WC794_05425 [Candidatus Doudnabacteria bacterium]|jgi:hypothetical protein
MDNLISGVLANYVPIIIIISLIVGIFVIGIAGIIRNSGKNDDIARSNLIIQTVMVGMIMLFLSGCFVFAFHKVYVSRYYADVQTNLSSKLSQNGDPGSTDLLQTQIQQAGTDTPSAKCILIVIDTVDCVKKTINDVIGSLVSVIVRALGGFVDTIVKYLNISFPFLFNLPADLFDSSQNLPADKLKNIANFDSLIKFSEVVGLAWVYLLMVTHYFKSIIFSLDSDYSNDFVGDIGKMILGFAGVFLARYMAEAVILTAQSFASFLFNTQLANGLVTTLEALINNTLWVSFGSFGLALVILAIFVLVYVILFGFIVFKNAKRYFTLLIMILLAPIFTPMLFFDLTRSMGTIFWTKFFTTSFGLMFDLLILSMIFLFLGSGGFSLGNLLLILVGMAIVADSNNLLQQIANASEVAGFRSVVRTGIKSGSNLYYKIRRLKD